MIPFTAIYRHLEMDRRGEMSDRDSDPAPFVRNSYIPETQQYLNYYGSQGSYAGACGFQTRILQVEEMSNTGEKRRRRRRMLSSWVKVSINRKSRILPNKTRSNCWLATFRFCMANKQQRRAIKTFRGSILIRDQSLTRNDKKKKRTVTKSRYLFPLIDICGYTNN